MTSQVTEQLVNYVEQYPVAGQDNDSQQFRTNFTVLKSALVTADNEITELQNNTAKTNVDTDFNSVIIENARVRRLYGIVIQGDTSDLSPTVNEWTVTDGTYFYAQTNGNTLIQLGGWPTTGTSAKEYRITIELRSSGTADEITFSSAGGGIVLRDSSGGIVAGVSSGTQKITLNASASIRTVIQAWTYNGGSTVFLSYIGQFQQ
jgi:hypothetical protein